MTVPAQNRRELELRVEDDVILIKWEGSLDIERIRQLMQFIESEMSARERVFLLADARAGGKIDPDARKLAIEWKLPRDLAGAAIFGASTPISILLNVLTKALRLVRGIMTPVHLASTEAAARAWINAERRRLQDS